MTLQELAAVTAISTALVGAASGGGKFYLDTQYVQVSDFHQALDEKEIRQLKREVRLLERRENLSDVEEYYLESLKDELEELMGN